MSKKKRMSHLKSEFEDEEYLLDNVDCVVNEPSDLEDPVCRRCGSTSWEYCTLGEKNTIKRCSDCPRRKDMH